ncbi:hypothetical protein AVEN_222121-1 [Araneus ventricosus]|uniref:Uncharacterized protein n=1 Tax=Araneus ventricosus TaxID=182803 RepID=A0A4Y2DU82_ARAVE|nr:hypothetical protein AVEN_222121-1 [Araneus ventricosus]
MPLDNKCRIGPMAWLPPHAYALVISIETEARFIAEDRTPTVGHTPACPRLAKIQSTLPMMWGGALTNAKSAVSSWWSSFSAPVPQEKLDSEEDEQISPSKETEAQQCSLDGLLAD